MKSAAKHVEDSEKGYQFSPLLIKCSNAVKLWQEVLARTRVRRPFTSRTLKLAEKVGVKLHVH